LFQSYEDFFPLNDFVYQQEHFAQLTVLTTFIKTAVNENKVTELMVGHIDDLIEKKIRPESLTFWKKIFEIEVSIKFLTFSRGSFWLKAKGVMEGSVLLLEVLRRSLRKRAL